MLNKVKLILFLGIIIIFSCDKNAVKIERKCFKADHSSDANSAVVNKLYIDTISLSSCSGSDTAAISLLKSSDGMQLEGNVFTWTPQVSQVGVHKVSCAVLQNGEEVDTVFWEIKVEGFWPPDCAPYTHKNDVTVGDPSTLPDGFFVYNPQTETGLFKSEIRQFNPQLIPNTIADRPGCISISDNGQWACYVDQSRSRICLVNINGCNKTVVPVSETDIGFPTIAGFYRNSPYGSEIFYLASNKVLKSVKVDFTGEIPVFSGDRVIADLGEQYRFNKDDFMQISVVKDQIYAEISPYVNGVVYSRTGYLTIPDGGRGIGGPEDVYQWKDDILEVVGGCGHTQSHDGLLCAANAGSIGSQCVPHSHKGFFITPFRRVTDPPVNMYTEHIDKFGTSINWCPLQYQNSSGFEVDYWGWYFSNRNDLIIGRQIGALNEDGLWVVDWEKSVWYRVTPIEKNIKALMPAVYFYPEGKSSVVIDHCNEDTSEKPLPYNPDTDFFNPHYKIKYPNGGEIFKVGDKVTVEVASSREGNAILNISYDNGLNWVQVPGLTRSINPLYDTKITFTIPDSVTIGRKKISTNSETCYLQLMDYGNSNFNDISDSPFSIIAR